MMRTPPSRWDEGIPALLLNYNYSGNQQTTQGRQDGSNFLGLDGQLNLLGWRVRSGLAWHRTQGGSSELNAQDVYAQHDYAFGRGGQLSVGRLSSDGSVVDSAPFTGMKIESDTGMLNPEVTDYRPAITGIANSPATVTVRQYGKVIYEQNVPQGPFALTGFNRTGNGDVDVEIREADGSVRHFTMSSAISPMLMRAGQVGYSLSAGQYRDGNGYVSPNFIQGNTSVGVGGNASLLTGALLSADYLAVSAGGGWYSGMLGAFSLTTTMSMLKMASFPGAEGTHRGISNQFNWSRNLWGATIGFAATRYDSRHFHSFSDAQGLRPDTLEEGTGQKNNYQLSLSQSLGSLGSLSVSASRSQYWGGQPGQKSYNVNYSTTIRDIGVSISAGLNAIEASAGEGSGAGGHYRQEARNDRNVMVNLSLPLAKWLGGHNQMSANYSWSSYNGVASQQAGVSGSALDGKASYNVSGGWGDS
ncbi:fimbria/pilus outer membrane usher protein, partial [Enterobacter ludwigii]|uniref:fimbria/pilus outer membrane usher protein n=1 Tax=Enterobacter ludwigii TaxID=299767 RepID=UPI003F6E976D